MSVDDEASDVCRALVGGAGAQVPAGHLCGAHHVRRHVEGSGGAARGSSDVLQYAEVLREAQVEVRGGGTRQRCLVEMGGVGTMCECMVDVLGGGVEVLGLVFRMLGLNRLELVDAALA